MINIVQKIQDNEKILLSPYAQLSSKSKGRKEEETPCDLRTIYQRDRDRIIHSKSFRRLKHKTQVYISPNGDHYRTRLTHTLEVSQIARTIARALSLNEDLVEAIALGHDLGHTPFGHLGEEVLNRLNPKGFHHSDQSIRVVEMLERRKGGHSGLNLSYEVLDGIKNHSSSGEPITLEGRLIKISDRIAYLNHDIDDSIRAGTLKEDDLPAQAIEILGSSHGSRIDTMVRDIIESSYGVNDILMGQKVSQASKILRDFMFKKVYNNSLVKAEADKSKYILEELYDYYLFDIYRLPKSHLSLYANDLDENQVVTDYIAGMTDKYVIHIFEEIFIPKSWEG